MDLTTEYVSEHSVSLLFSECKCAHRRRREERGERERERSAITREVASGIAGA